jgi:hypothetical protein
MSAYTHSLARSWVLPILLSPAVLLRCSGTEADNPVTDVVVTACKSEPEYDPRQLGEFFSQMEATQTARTSAADVFKSTQAPGEGVTLGRALTSSADIPLGLMCLEWQRSEQSLRVQIVNFGSGCGAEWEGRATRTGDRVTLLLDNRICAVAACGNCLYDTASEIELPAQSDVTLELSLDPYCSGERKVHSWQLPLTRAERGISCEFATAQGLGSVSKQAFLWCAEEDGSCDDGLTCVPGDEPVPRCLPACNVDEDCPLPGGTRCDAGHCIPSGS